MHKDIDQIFDSVFGRDDPLALPDDRLGLAARVLEAAANHVDPGPLNGRSREDTEGERAFDALLAVRTGQLFNLPEVARRVNVRYAVATERLERHIAEGRMLMLPPHPESGYDGEGHPKLHVVDLGWLASRMGWTTRRQIIHPRNIGALMETAVVSEWAAFFRAHGVEPRMSYWAAGPGKEIDLMIEHEGELRAVEVKSTPSPVARHADGIKAWYGRFLRVIPAVIACRVVEPVELVYGIRAVPWQLTWPGRAA